MILSGVITPLTVPPSAGHVGVLATGLGFVALWQSQTKIPPFTRDLAKWM